MLCFTIKISSYFRFTKELFYEKTTLFYAFEKTGVRQNPWKPTEMLFWLTNLLKTLPECFYG